MRSGEVGIGWFARWFVEGSPAFLDQYGPGTIREAWPAFCGTGRLSQARAPT